MLGAASSLQNCTSITLTKITRTVTLQDVPLLNVTSGPPFTPEEVTNLVREYPEKLPKIATSNVIFLRTADRMMVSPRNFALQFKRSIIFFFFFNNLYL